MCVFLTFALVLQGMFHNGGWVGIPLQNKEEDKVLFCIPGRYYESATDTHGHGTMVGYDLVGSGTHIVYARAFNAELEIENWPANQKIITNSKIVRKGIRGGMYWRSDAFLKESGGIVFTLYGYGKDSLEINHILDSAHIGRANENTYWEEYSVEHQQNVITSDLEPIIKDYLNKPWRIGDDSRSINLVNELANMRCKTKDIRSLYFHLFNEVIQQSDGAIREAICDCLATIVDEQPSFIFNYLRANPFLSSKYQELLALYYYYYDKIDILAIEDKMKRRCCKDMEQWLSVFYQEIVLMKNAIED